MNNPYSELIQIIRKEGSGAVVGMKIVDGTVKMLSPLTITVGPMEYIGKEVRTMGHYELYKGDGVVCLRYAEDQKILILGKG